MMEISTKYVYSIHNPSPLFNAEVGDVNQFLFTIFFLTYWKLRAVFSYVASIYTSVNLAPIFVLHSQYTHMNSHTMRIV